MNDYIIGVDLGGTNVRSALVYGGKISKIAEGQISSKETEKVVIDEIIACIENVFHQDTKSIGIGVPGIVNTQQGIVYDVQNIPSWKEVYLKDIIEKHFNIPVFINNDANCFAVGESIYGHGKGYNHVVGLILGTGVAAGMVLNGRVYEGRNCGAGEFGMLPYLDNNYEFYCSGNYFKHFHQITGDQAYLEAQNGNTEMMEIFSDYGKHLSMVIKAVLLTIDPEIIVLGGSVSKSFYLFKESLMSNLLDFPYRPVIENICIKSSSGENKALLGAAGLGKHRF
jgi:glucokinase